jgi:hypothetical protein
LFSITEKRVGEYFQPRDQLQYLRYQRATVLCAKAGNPKFKNSPKTLPITPLYSSLHDATTDLK